MRNRHMSKIVAALALVAASHAGASLLAVPALPITAKSATIESKDGAYRIGVPRDVPTQAARDAVAGVNWRLENSRWVGTITVRVEGAAALRVALQRLPADATVTFRSAAAQWTATQADVQRAIAQGSAYWGPVTVGVEQVIEISAATRPLPADIALGGISQLLATPAEALLAKSAQGCHEDVACVREQDPAFLRAVRSVAKIVYTRDGATYACSGTLVAGETAAAPAPMLLTAKHCIDNAAVAATVNTFWFLEAEACGSKSQRVPVQLAGGARLLYTAAESDVALLRLRDAPPAGAEFVRIDPAAPLRDEPVVAIHHPRGDPKKISSGLVTQPEEGVAGRLMSVAWLSGATEPGSSGSGVFTKRAGEWRLRGTLRGGSASCSSTGAMADPANRDYYTRIDLESQALRGFLDAVAFPDEDFSDMWHAVASPGQGLSVVQHASGMIFAVWFTYDAAGQPTWLVVPGGRWESGRRFRGDVYRANQAGAKVDVTPIGQASLDFGTSGASLELVVAGQSRTVALARQTF